MRRWALSADALSLDGRLDTACPICLCTLATPVTLAGCLHSFCLLCLEKWLLVSETCPLCKAVVAVFVSAPPRGGHLLFSRSDETARVVSDPAGVVGLADAVRVQAALHARLEARAAGRSGGSVGKIVSRRSSGGARGAEAAAGAPALLEEGRGGKDKGDASTAAGQARGAGAGRPAPAAAPTAATVAVATVAATGLAALVADLDAEVTAARTTAARLRFAAAARSGAAAR